MIAVEHAGEGVPGAVAHGELDGAFVGIRAGEREDDLVQVSRGELGEALGKQELGHRLEAGADMGVLAHHLPDGVQYLGVRVAGVQAPSLGGAVDIDVAGAIVQLGADAVVDQDGDFVAYPAAA